MNASRKAFLDMIAWSEGTSTHSLTQHDGYDVIVTGVDGKRVFTDFSNHPFANGGYVTVRTGPPPLNSTAAGRYQFLARFWNIYRTQLRLPDFGPDSQDTVALQMIRERGALPLIDAGDIEGAIQKCANLWASLPGNSYGQNPHKAEVLIAKYAELSTPGPQSA